MSPRAGGVNGPKCLPYRCSASQVWAAVDRRLGIPLNATWAMTALAFLIGLPLLHSDQTFFALASISSVGLNLSCEGPSSHMHSHSCHRAHAGCTETLCIACGATLATQQLRDLTARPCLALLLTSAMRCPMRAFADTYNAWGPSRAQYALQTWRP